MIPDRRQTHLDFSASPAILTFWHEEMDDPADDFMTDEEIESAFVSSWAVVLHDIWIQMDWALFAGQMDWALVERLRSK